MLKRYHKLGIAAISAILALGAGAIESAQAASFKFSFGALGSEGSLSFTDSPLTGIGRETVSLQELEGANFEYFLSDLSDSNPGDVPGTIVAQVYNFQISSNLPDISFDFNNGKLVGLNHLSSANKVDFLTTGGSRAFRVKGDIYVLSRGDRFLDYFEGQLSSGGAATCLKDNELLNCFDNNVQNYTTQTSTTGIFINTDAYREEQLAIIRDGNLIFEDRTMTLPSSSTFYSFDNLPRQITFTTLEAVPRDPAAVPEPSSIFGIGVAIAGGGFLKRQQKKAKSYFSLTEKRQMLKAQI